MQLSNKSQVTYVPMKGERFTTCATGDSDYPFGIALNGKHKFSYHSVAARNSDLKALQLAAGTGGWRVLQEVKNYMADNRDLVFTICLVAIADQFLFEGALRERIKKLIEGILTKTEAKVSQTGV